MENIRKHLLSFVVDKDSSQLFIHTDEAGIDYLISKLNEIKNGLAKGKCGHDHLFSKEWGVGDLSTSKIKNQPGEDKSIHHVKIYGWTDKWRKKHKLDQV